MHPCLILVWPRVTWETKISHVDPRGILNAFVALKFKQFLVKMQLPLLTSNAMDTDQVKYFKHQDGEYVPAAWDQPGGQTSPKDWCGVVFKVIRVIVLFIPTLLGELFRLLLQQHGNEAQIDPWPAGIGDWRWQWTRTVSVSAVGQGGLSGGSCRY